MKIKQILAAIALLLAIQNCLYAQETLIPRSRQQLLEENKRLREEIRKLNEQLQDLTSAQSAADSIAGEMIEIFEENEGRNSDALRPENYTPEVTDSLLSLWYRNRGQFVWEENEMNPDLVRYTSNVPDSVYIKRLEKMNSFITLPYNETVRNYIIMYSEKKAASTSRMLAMSDYYFPIFEETFAKYGMPLELKYMAVIESALNPTATSRAGAKGIWQFMYRTAQKYGLKINSFVDERMDVVKAADAAARYLKDAYAIFGDWNLAISSYNCGPGNVNKAIRRAGGSRDFWTVYTFLPRETRGYVPAFVGAMYAFNYHKEHGISPATDIRLPVAVDTFEIRKNLHFKQVEDVVGVPTAIIKALNPQYVADIVPGNEGMCILTVPSDFTSNFIEREDSLYTYKYKELFTPSTLKDIHDGVRQPDRIYYKVKKGDYLGRIAARYHVSVAQIKRWNGLKNDNLRVGQRLVIYRGGRGPAASSPSGTSASKGSAGSAAKSSGSKGTSTQAGTTIYTVKSGDNLYDIAKKYPGVSAKDIQQANGLSGSRITVGQKLKIPKAR